MKAQKISIKTSEAGWFTKLTQAYEQQLRVQVLDDAQVGLSPAHQSLFEMGRVAKLSSAEWMAVFVSLGVSAAGLWIIRLAVVDPEPTSKLWLLLAGGILCVLTGGGYAVYILTSKRPPNLKAGLGGFQLSWD